MGGFAGILSSGADGRADSGVLDRMLAAIAHRGPEHLGRYSDARLSLGARRLPIVDPDHSSQPVRNEDGRIVVACNGEIYNYRALRVLLRADGHAMTTSGDAEVVAHLYEDVGEKCVHELEGMFAFALWDTRRRRLVLARDRLGIKPLYWAQRDGRLLFGSEIKALLAHPSLDARLDFDALAALLSLRYVPAPRTMFAGVHALPPGHLLIAEGSRVVVRRWWDLSFRAADPPPTEDEAAEELRERLRAAVRTQMEGGARVGAFLSGGLDSSTLVALMSRESARPVPTFAAGFATDDGAAEDERPYARLIARHYATDHHEVVATAADLVRLAEKLVWHLDQPIADNSCLAHHLLAELASRHVPVVFVGDGGDELFAGYARHAGERLAPAFDALPPALRARGQALAARGGPLARPRIALNALCQTGERARLASWHELMHTDARAALAEGELARAAAAAPPATLLADPLRRFDARDPLARILYAETKLWLPDDLLARADKLTMAASLEARVPLLDHRLAEFAAALPPGLKIRGLTRKYLLRRVARDWLPATVTRRGKRRFPMPMDQWLRGGARELCHDTLSAASVRRRGLFSEREVERLLAEHDTGRRSHGSVLWALISIELWHRAFVDGAPAASMRRAA